MEVGGQVNVPSALLPGKNMYPLYRRLGWTGVENLAHAGIRSPELSARSESLYLLSYLGYLLLGAVNCSKLSVVLAPLLLCKTVNRHCCYFSGNPRPEFDLRIKRMSLLIASREE